MLSGVDWSGRVLVMKLFLDLRRLLAAEWLYRGCLSSVACFKRSTLLATALLMSGGAIPTNSTSYKTTDV